MKNLEKHLRALQGLKKDPPGLWGLTQSPLLKLRAKQRAGQTGDECRLKNK